MFDSITQHVRRLVAGRSTPPPPNLMREFADALSDPLVLPLLLELKLYAGKVPVPLYLAAAALHGFLRYSSAGSRQFILADALASARGEDILVTDYYADLEDKKAIDAPAVPPTPLDAMRFKMVGEQPVPVPPTDVCPGAMSFMAAVDRTGWTPVALATLYRTMDGTQPTTNGKEAANV